MRQQGKPKLIMVGLVVALSLLLLCGCGAQTVPDE